jgi:putative transcriptional regulator|tara:strand:- start:440 stop:628 length:189 start_codon:yes stop_codon:yes gene_type:complete
MIRLKHYRTLANLSQLALSRTVGCTKQQISAIERGVNEPSIRLALKIGEALKVSLDDLFRDE